VKYYDLHYFERFADKPSWVGGYAKRWKIYILEKYRNDKGILEHEKCHVRQWWYTLGLFGILYRFEWFRLWSEVQAYKLQIACYDYKNYKFFAQMLANRYNLDITEEEALQKLRG
jgi:hypothetical protein